MRTPEISPYIRRAWYDTLDANGYIPERVIFDYELLYIKDGKCVIRVENREYHPKPGDLFLLRPKVTHAIDVAADTPLIQPHIHFDLCRREDSEKVPICMSPLSGIAPEQLSFFRPDDLAECIPNIPDYVHVSDIKYVENTLTNIIFLHKHKDSIFDSLKEQSLFIQLLNYILYEMTVNVSQHSGGILETAQRIKTYLDCNSRSRLSLAQVADKCFVSKCYMVSAFKTCYGISPYKYHQQQQINEAKYILKFTNMTISEVAACVGFDDLHSFNAIFTRIEHISPSEYRKLPVL